MPVTASVGCSSGHHATIAHNISPTHSCTITVMSSDQRYLYQMTPTHTPGATRSPMMQVLGDESAAPGSAQRRFGAHGVFSLPLAARPPLQTLRAVARLAYAVA